MISEQDRNSLIVVRDALRSGALNDHFDMDISCDTHHCGTVACIGGWMKIHQLHGSLDPQTPDGITKAASCYVYSGVEASPFRRLFYPYGVYGWSKITPEEAATAIDNFLKDGNPRWSEVVSFEKLLGNYDD